ncbi:LysR family transcriptional regulator [Sporolactobacillus sp. CQH2019]|uniref:LysR family transcriptional regulator n=1 Tax=Sporolactobacillus sp. CQH2019 TaxID=3023512 RepID=UPI00236801B7|nr:LysR family transcriptional regulator [Sporolactobacillus sp. CQH2019]MDD9148534.1 LysR family transcriptional regulator [Sporolactobacillus sp. CQH2019]
MEIKQLITFQKAAEKLNFTHTAEQLNFAQSSVTAHIKSLEDELGVQLFDRLGKSLALTDAGRKLQIYANQILSLTNEARKAVMSEKEPSGTLVIGATESLCTYRLPPILSDFRHRYPKVRFHFSPGISDRDILDRLEKGSLDAAILMDVDLIPDVFVIEKLKKETIGVVAAPDHPLFRKKTVVPADLYEESLLLTEKNCSYRRQFDRDFSNCGLVPEHVFEFASVEAIKQCVIAGLGIAVLPEITFRKELGNGEIALLPWGGTPLSVHSHLVRHKDKWLSPALAAFLNLTRESLKD